MSTPQLSTFRMHLIARNEKLEYLLNFLSAAKKLKVIDVDDCVVEKVFSSSSNFDFKLKRFQSYSHRPLSPAAEENFVKFLKSQASCLEEFRWNRLQHSMTKVVLTELKNLVKLELDSESLPTDKSFYDQLKPMEKLRSFPGLRVPKFLLGLLPNLEQLKTSEGSSIILFLSTYNPSLKSLSIGSFRDEVDAKVVLKKLEYFYVEWDSGTEHLIKFLTNNPTIVTFCSRYYADNTQLIDVLLNMPNLKHLKLGGEVTDLQSTFKKIKNNPKRLETLEMIFEKVPGRPNILFRFPQDADKWEEKTPFLKTYVKDAESEFGYRISVCHTSEFVY